MIGRLVVLHDIENLDADGLGDIKLRIFP